jgi:uncharacterized membrane protein YhaH (DUF805 family)
MGFGDAVAICLRRFFAFGGRARRSEFWYWVLFYMLANMALTIVDLIVVGISTGPFSTFITIALLPPTIAALARRLHDTDRSAWWILLPIAPIPVLIVTASPLLAVFAAATILVGFVLVLLMAAAPGTAGPNRFGPEPA